MASKNWVKISWSNVFLPDGTKPLSELFFAIIWTDFDIPVAFTWGSYFRWIVQMPIIKMCLNFAQTRLLPGTNEIRETSYRTEKWNENKEYCQTFDIRSHLRQYNCWLLRCSWSIACRHCSNYIFSLDLTPGFNRSGKDNCKTRRETFKCWDFVCLILEVWQ